MPELFQHLPTWNQRNKKHLNKLKINPVKTHSQNNWMSLPLA